MYKDSQHLEKLLNDLLELSKLDTTNDSLDKKSTAPKILYDKALKSLAGIIENKNIEIEKKIEPDLPEIDIDRNKMHQVLINLIENAVNYSPANSQITLKAEKATENNFKVKFSIIDNGIGIPEEELDNIWERFYKIDSARSRDNHKGSGLGLAIVKDIIKKHGAVSEKVSREMAANVRNVFDSDIGAGITGIAGPNGGTEEKPVGLVYFTINIDDKNYSFKREFIGDRKRIINKTINSLFIELIKLLDKK